MGLLDDIGEAKRNAVERVIGGGMREDLHMAQVIAAEDVVIKHLDEARQLFLKKPTYNGPERRRQPRPPAGTSGAAQIPLLPD